MGSGAIVPLQPDNLRAREVILEFKDVANLGPAPAINRLIIIANAADISVPLCQQSQQKILCDVCILIFIHEDIFEPVLVNIENIRVLLKQRQHM